MSDLQWHKLALESRLAHPERYADEDVGAVIEQLKKTIQSSEQEAV